MKFMLFEPEDFGPALTPEIRDQVDRLRDQVSRKQSGVSIPPGQFRL